MSVRSLLSLVPSRASAAFLASVSGGRASWPARLRAASGPLLMVGGLVAIGLTLRGLGLHEAIGELAAEGPLRFVVAAGLACAVGLPRQAAAYAAGYAYGFWPGFGAALAAMAIGCATDFTWARLLARRWVASRLPARVRRFDALLSQRPFAATLMIRLLPVGSNVLLNLVAGVSGVRAAPFLAASLLGYVPQAAVFALLGAGTGLGQAGELLLGGALLLVSTLLGWRLLRQARDATEEEGSR